MRDTIADWRYTFFEENLRDIFIRYMKNIIVRNIPVKIFINRAINDVNVNPLMTRRKPRSGCMKIHLRVYLYENLFASSAPAGALKNSRLDFGGKF